MGQPPAEVIAAIEGPTTHLSFKCDIFMADGVTPFGFGLFNNRLMEGQVTIDFSRDERRACTLTLDNSDLLLINNPDNIWYDKVFKPYYTVLYKDSLGASKTYSFQMGEFVIDSITEPYFPNVMSLSLRDYTKRLLTSKYPQTIIYSSGQALEVIVKTIAQNGGISKFILPVTGVVTGKDFQFEKGDTRWSAVLSIANAYNYDVYFDSAGYLVMTLFQDPIAAALIYQLQASASGNIVDYTKTTNDTRLYNHVVVTGDSSDPEVIPVSAEALNTEPSSPTNIARLGDRVYQYDSSFITTEEQAQAVADSFLAIHALEEYNIDFGSICYPWFEVGFIIGFTDPKTSEFIRLLMTSLNIALTPEPMTGSAKRVRIVS